MADIFISYSRKDLDQALSLVERLKAEGFDVWIDRHGIEGANSWSKEIANALESASIFLLLLSDSSVASANVSKELGVATLLQKRIVPLRLDRVELRGEFLYHLANLQYVRFEEFDALVSVLSGKPAVRGMTPAKNTDERKSLMILPFEDLSPTADNEWFADGIVNELIGSLTHVKALRVKDQQTTKEYKSFKEHLATYATEMRIRYFLQGDVRKFGDQIKISCSLLDIETGDHLWQDSYKGTMADIFDMQEQVAKKVVDGLKVHLLADEQKKLSSRGTDNPEAYELYLRTYDYFERNSKEHTEYAIKAIGLAIELDPDFALAKLRRAIVLTSYSINYGPHPEMIEEADVLLTEARKTITPEDDWRVLGVEGLLAQARGESERAEALMKENLRIDPNDLERIHTLAAFYVNAHRHAEALPLMERMLELSPANFAIARGIITLGWGMNDREMQLTYIRKYDFLSIYRTRMRTVPEDDNAMVVYGLMLIYLGRMEDARHHLDSIADPQITTMLGCRNGACLAAQLGEPDRAIRWLQQLAAFGERIEFPDTLTDPELAALHGREDFKLLLQESKRRVESNG